MENFFDGFARTEKFENRLHRYPLAADRRLSVANILIDRDPVDDCVHNAKISDFR